VERVAAAVSIVIPFVVLGELFYGARNSSHWDQNLARVELLASRFNVLFADLFTIREYGRIRAELKAAGRPIPEADLWIAALSLQHQLTLVSRDDHFREVSGIQLECW
jgi:tRNA(fMet)-specific endonuclease VapC